MHYSYKLEGSNTGWVNNQTESVVSFANLPAGEYVFRLKAKPVGENQWKEMDQPFHFIILRHWYKTGWFMACMMLLSGIVLLSLVRLYYRQFFEKKRILMEQELLVEQERTKLAQELHDGLGSKLSGVKHSFSSLMNELKLDPETTSLFHKNIDKLNASIREIRNISHNLYSQSLGKVGIDDLVEEYCLVKSSEQNIPVLFSKYSTEQLSLTEAQSFHIFRMVQELLENIIRHSGATEAMVQLSYNNHTLYITIEDNGTGFDVSKKNKSKGIGLKNVETRVRSLGGSLNIKSEKGQGTSILIEIPAK
jgi:signal transduction histidine kinase